MDDGIAVEEPAVFANTAPYPTWTVDHASSLRIGSVMQEGDDALFTDVRFAASLSDGRIVVADRSSEIRWFGRDGALSSRAGGRGEGPGEFSRVQSGTVLTGDTVVFFDPGNGRLTWFDPEGRLTRTRRLHLGFSLGVTLHEVGSGRLLVAVEGAYPNLGGEAFNYTRDSIFAVVVSEPGRADTVLRLPGKEAITWVDYAGGRPRGTQQMELPFGERTLMGAVGESLVIAHSGNGELTFFGLDGNPVLAARRSDLDPPTVSSESRRQYQEVATARRLARGVPETQARAWAAAMIDLLPEGRSAPVYDRMLVDRPAGRLWLRDHVPLMGETGPRWWTVYDGHGRVLARLTTPAGLVLEHVAEDRLVGTVRDEMGVEFVTVLGVVH